MNTSDMHVGQIGEYRELAPEERREYLMRLIEVPRNEKLAIQKAGVKGIAEMFNEALSCLTDGIDWLERIDKQYIERYADDDCEMPEHLFWWGVNDVIKLLRDILQGLEAVEKCVPKETEPSKERVR